MIRCEPPRAVHGQAGQANQPEGGRCDCPGPCTLTRVVTATGATSVTTYFYDAEGKRIREETDTDQDGVIDATLYYSYDDTGQLIEKRSEACGSSGITAPDCTWITYSYDEQGNLLIENSQNSGPGLAAMCQVHTYDEQGLLVRTEYRRWCQDDPSSLERTYTYEYDEAGLVASLHYEGSSSSFTDAYEYDADSHVSRETFTHSDGTVDVILYTRNAAGLVLIQERRYEESDDHKLVYTYDDAGNQLTMTTVYLEGESAGEEQRCYVATYDDCGNKLTEGYSQTCDETRAFQDTWSYACFEP